MTSHRATPVLIVNRRRVDQQVLGLIDGGVGDCGGDLRRRRHAWGQERERLIRRSRPAAALHDQPLEDQDRPIPHRTKIRMADLRRYAGSAGSGYEQVDPCF